MKATIITFDKKVIEIPEYRTTIKRRVRHFGNESLICEEGKFPEINPLDQTEDKVYQSILIQEYDKNKHLYYVSREEARDAILILDEIIRQEVEDKTFKYKLEIKELKLQWESSIKWSKKLEGLFFVKIYLWVTRYFRKGI